MSTRLWVVRLHVGADQFDNVGRGERGNPRVRFRFSVHCVLVGAVVWMFDSSSFWMAPMKLGRVVGEFFGKGFLRFQGLLDRGANLPSASSAPARR